MSVAGEPAAAGQARGSQATARESSPGGPLTPCLLCWLKPSFVSTSGDCRLSDAQPGGADRVGCAGASTPHLSPRTDSIRRKRGKRRTPGRRAGTAAFPASHDTLAQPAPQPPPLPSTVLLAPAPTMKDLPNEPLPIGDSCSCCLPVSDRHCSISNVQCLIVRRSWCRASCKLSAGQASACLVMSAGHLGDPLHP